MSSRIDQRTPEQLRRRAYNTRHSRQRRDRELDAKRQSARVCPKQHGSGICGGRLRIETDRLGRVISICALCERQRAGICRDCPRPVEGGRNALRCATHKEIARKRQIVECRERLRDVMNERARERYSADPVRRKRSNEMKRIWRLANPDKVRAQKKRYAQKYGSDKKSRYLEYHRRYNAQAHRARRKREQATAAYYQQNPTRPDPKCAKCGDAIPWTPLRGGHAGRPAKNCDKCCSKYELANRAGRREAAALRDAQPIAKPRPKVRPIKAKTPMPAPYAPSGERLCLTTGCDIVVTHRKKKCGRCRQRAAALAQNILAKTAGRGRRTDLEVRAA